jgi:hypothetical protein
MPVAIIFETLRPAPISMTFSSGFDGLDREQVKAVSDFCRAQPGRTCAHPLMLILF